MRKLGRRFRREIKRRREKGGTRIFGEKRRLCTKRGKEKDRNTKRLKERETEIGPVCSAAIEKKFNGTEPTLIRA